MNEILIRKLQNGETVQSRRKGNSMTPIIRSGQTVTIAPIDIQDIKKGNVVFCKWKRYYFCHLVTAVDYEQNRVQVSNNHGHVNGWTHKVFGKVIEVEGKPI